MLFRLQSGLLLGGPCVIDTLHLDTDKMELSLTWRASLTRSRGAPVGELRFEVDPGKPLLDLPPLAAKHGGVPHEPTDAATQELR